MLCDLAVQGYTSVQNQDTAVPPDFLNLVQIRLHYKNKKRILRCYSILRLASRIRVVKSKLLASNVKIKTADRLSKNDVDRSFVEEVSKNLKDSVFY